MKLHKEGKQVFEEEEESPLHKELQTKQRRDPTFLKPTNFEPAIGTSHLKITSPTSPHTHLSLPLPIINVSLDEILPTMNLNLDEHFEHMDLDIPHISPTTECIIKPILKPTKTPIEPAPTPSLQPIITLPIEESTHREPPTTKETQALSTSQVKEGLCFDKMSRAGAIEDKV